jgi:orotidine-5'-phosphate decarboxylase
VNEAFPAGAGLVVALDVRHAADAVRIATQVAPHAAAFQVGLGLLHGPGAAVTGAIAPLGPVLVDASLHGIPSAVAAAARRLGEYGARWVTAHALGGRDMLEAAAAGLAEGAAGRPAGILAITVLTSLDSAALAAAGLGGSPGKLAARLAKVADAARVEGVVCPVPQLGVVAEVAPRLLRVTPGIRPGGGVGDDQRAAADAGEAARRGANLVVVGRPVVQAADPAEAAAALSAALSAR